MQRFTNTPSIRSCSTFIRPSTIKLTKALGIQRATIMPLRSANNNTSILTQQYRSMATIQTTTDVASATYHFKKQKHLPYFLEYLMWVVFGSECLHLIWIKSESKEYKEHTQRKISLLNDLLALLESNSPVPETLREEIRMVMLDEKFNKQLLYQDSDIEDDYLEKLIAVSEEAEQASTASTALPIDTEAAPASTTNENTTSARTNAKETRTTKFII